jgi:hypothetical protein
MKKLLFLFFVATLASCTQNNGINIDNNTNGAASDLIGTWNVTAQRIENGATETTFGGQTTTVNFESYGKDFNFTYVFTGSPNNVVAQGTYTNVVTTTVAGQVVTQETPARSIDGFDNGTWILGTNTLTIATIGGNSDVAFIEEFTPTKLVLKIIIDQTIDQGGIAATTKGTMYLVLEK